MDKEAAQKQYDTMAGKAMLQGALDALRQTGHTKAADHPGKVIDAIQGMNNVMQKEAEKKRPVIDQSDMTGLDALAAHAQDDND